MEIYQTSLFVLILLSGLNLIIQLIQGAKMDKITQALTNLEVMAQKCGDKITNLKNDSVSDDQLNTIADRINAVAADLDTKSS